MRSLRPIALALALAVPVTAFTTTARASDAAAAEAFKAGAAAYQRGDYRGAAASFERAYKESPRAAAIYNAGLAWEAAADAPRAADAYAAALDGGDLGGQQKKDAQTRLAALAKTLGRADVTGPAGTTITVEHREGAAVPVKVYLTAGAHELSATLPDAGTVKRNVAVTAGATTPFVLEAPRKEPPPPPPVAKVEAPPASPPPPPKATGTSPRKLVGYVALGGAVVASGAAVYLGLSALSARDEFDNSGHKNQNAHDRADSLRTTTNVAWIAAGVLAAGGVVLVLTAPKGPSTATATLGPTGGTLTVRF